MSGSLVETGLLLLCLAWVPAQLYSLWMILRIPALDGVLPQEPAGWPTLSVVIAARDEEDHIAQTVEALLAQDYPGLELVLVNDRSSDKTGAILDRLAIREPRLKVIHLTKLPAGWLGKVHALQRGLAAAGGEWLLFSDGDVHFAPHTLHRAVMHAGRRNYDHLTLLPRVIPASFSLQVVMAALQMLFLLGARLHQVAKPGKKAALGIGAFNLFRRSAYDRTPGLEWLRMEVVDDVGLALMLKKSGAKCGYAYGGDAVSLAWYPSLRAMFLGLEKNLFGAGAHYSWLRLAAQVTALPMAALAPWLALLAPAPGLKLAGGLAYGLMAVNLLVGRKRFGAKLLPGLLAPLAAPVVSGMMFNAGWRCLRQGGIRWRDTFYPIKELKKGQRVRL